MTSEVPFAKLVALDEINARAAIKDGIDELAASIAAKGLIQPLAVRPADGSDKFEIIDGRRRYQAMAKLVKAKKWTKNELVPVLVRNEDNAEALETSLMANTVRLPMHPVDQHEVFARLVDQGKTLADIAASFGLAERTVKQHMALGRLAPEVRDAWRKGALDAKAAQAFTLHADPAVQANVLAELQRTLGRSHVQEYSVRHRFAERSVAEHKVPAGAMKLYLAAGGTISEDLFSDESYCDDAALVEASIAKWAESKTEDLKSCLLANGWAWVMREKEYTQAYNVGHWDLPSLDDEDQEDSARPYRCEKIDLDLIDTETAQFTPAERARTGVVIHCYTSGDTMVSLGIKKLGEGEGEGDGEGQTDLEDAVAAEGSHLESEDDDENGAPDASAGPVKYAGDPYAVSGALNERVTTALTLAAAEALATAPGTALRVLLAALRVSSWSTPSKVSLSRFGARFVGAEAERDFDTEFAHAENASTDQVMRDLAIIVASSLNLVRYHYDAKPRHDEAALVDALPQDAFLTAACRHFNVGDYFKSATKATALAAIEEMCEAGCSCGMAPIDVLAGMKKAELASAAANAATACGWLPPQLRHQAYTLEAQPTRLTGKTAAAEQSSEVAPSSSRTEAA